MTYTNSTARIAILAAGLFIGAAATPALAADVITEAPPAPPAAPMEEPPVGWDGAYAGITGSFTSGLAHHSQPFANRHVIDGFNGGAFAGYNFQQGNMVYGLEADISGGGIDGNNAGRGLETSVDGSLRARAGVALGDRTLLYGTGGLVVGKLRAAEGGVLDTKTGIGWTAGAGVDVKLTDNMFARTEYRYIDYGSKNFTTGSGTNSVDVNENRFIVGIGMKF
ncbi:outer membrane protein [Zhengella mangrovi]|nr:outer membrane protein [Zhengella mangrovi]